MGRAGSRTQTLFAGSLADVSFGDLFQTLEMAGKASRIEFDTDVGAVTVWFRERMVVGATCGETRGAEAIYRLALADEGNFVASFKDEEPPEPIRLSPQFLLMEAARRRDEWLERAGEGLRPTTRVEVVDRVREERGGALGGEEQALLERVGEGAQLVELIPPAGEEGEGLGLFRPLRALIADGLLRVVDAAGASSVLVTVTEVPVPVPQVEDFWTGAFATYVALGDTGPRAIARVSALGVMLAGVVLGLVWGSSRVLLGGQLLGWSLFLLGHAASSYPQLPFRRPLLLLCEPLLTAADLLGRVGVKIDFVGRGRELARGEAG